MRVADSLILGLATLYPLAQGAAVGTPERRGILGSLARVAATVAATEDVNAVSHAGNDNTQAPSSGKISYSCSADSSTAQVAPFAQQPAWGTSMLNCLHQMNNTAWNGYECVPNNGNGASLGVSFGFYKHEDGTSFSDVQLHGDTCFNNCVNCLTTGIHNQRAVTTSCSWGTGNAKCEMGFNYGT